MVKQNLLTKLLLLFALIVGSTSVWGQNSANWSYTVVNGDASKLNNTAKTFTVDDDHVWSYEGTTVAAGTSPSITIGNYSGTYGIKFGESSSKYYNPVILSTNAFSEVNVTKVSLKLKHNGGKVGTLTVKQGDITIGTFTTSQTSDWITVTCSETNQGDGGKLEIKYEVAQALYVNKIEVWYEDAQKPSHTATFSVNGTLSTQDFKEGAEIEFPEVADVAGLKCIGWTTTELSVAQDSAPEDLSNKFTMGTEDATFYAVFALVNGTPATLTKMESSDSFTDGENIVIVAKDGDQFFALYQETQNTSWVGKYEFDGDVNTVAAKDKNWITVTASESGWIFGDDTNGYLYSSSSNNLALDKTGNSSSFTLAYSEGNGFTLKYGTRWLSLRTDADTNKFRLGGNGSTPLGVGYFDIYKYVSGSETYSNYCTTITLLANITSAGYATFSSAEAVDFSANEGLTVFTAKDNDNGTSVTLNEVESKKVPANTAVVLKGAEGDYTGTVVASAEALADNDLKVATEDLNGNGKIYVLNKVGDKVGFYKLSETGTLSKGKAYLESENAAPFLGFDGEDTTGINSVERGALSVEGCYTLDGRRVAQPTKGLYILNGKKVLIP